MSSGRVPNLLWQAITFEELRCDPTFDSLPPVDELRLEGTHSYRYVRQDSALWDALHAGVLTTSCLNGALGFYEPRASKVLRLPKGYASHNQAMSAYRRLCLPQYTPPFESPAVEQPPPSARKSSGPALVDVHQSTKRHKGAPSNAQPAKAMQMSTSKVAKTRAAVYRKSAAAAERGEGGVRVSWGTAQEAATLHAVMAAFPDSQLQEVGLCYVDPDTLPPEWGFPPGSLPPLGASPDGMLTHFSQQPTQCNTTGRYEDVLPVSSAAVQQVQSTQDQAVQQSTPSQQPVQQNTGQSQVAVQQQAGTPELHTARGEQISNSRGIFPPPGLSDSVAGVAIERLLHRLEVAQTKDTVASDTVSNHPQHKQHGTGLMHSPSVSIAEKTMHDPGNSQAPTNGHAQLQHRGTYHMQADGRIMLSSPSTAGDTADMKAPPSQTTATSGRPGPTPTNAAATHGLPMQEHMTPEVPLKTADPAGIWSEVVEVKNTSPFSGSIRVNKKGIARKLFVVSDRGPRDQVPVIWVAQLQMEMFASPQNAQSALLVSRSATQGINVFRMQRNEDFLRLMLHFVSVFYTTFVKAGVVPHVNMMTELPGYTEFLQLTVRIAREAPCIMHIAKPAIAKGSDMRRFLS